MLSIEETVSLSKTDDRVGHVALWWRTLKKTSLWLSWLMGKQWGCGGVKDNSRFCKEVVVAFC